MDKLSNADREPSNWVQIRPGNTDDTRTLIELNAREYGQEPYYPTSHDILSRMERKGLILKRGDASFGFVVFKFYGTDGENLPAALPGPTMYVERLYIDKTARNAGVISKFIVALKNEAKRRGVVYAAWHVAGPDMVPHSKTVGQSGDSQDWQMIPIEDLDVAKLAELSELSKKQASEDV